jgi:hypothetical protein
MPIVLQVGPAIPNKAPPINAAQKEDFYQNVKKLTYAGLWGGAGNIVEGPLTRIDNQGPFMGNGSNIQAQLNGVHGHSTFSCALLDPELGPPNVPNAGNQAYVLNRVQTALTNSQQQQLVYTVTGTAP